MSSVRGFSGTDYTEALGKFNAWLEAEYFDEQTNKQISPKVKLFNHYTVGHSSRLTGNWVEHIFTVIYEWVEVSSQFKPKEVSKPKPKSKAAGKK